tara:strand:+ start:5877 stop:6299 length:423 start_codon:yes stop_codon:yes gene_type:complete
MTWKNILKQELTLLIEPIKNKINSLIEEYRNTPNKPRLNPYGELEVNKRTKRGNMLIDIKLTFYPEEEKEDEHIKAYVRFTKLPAESNRRWGLKPTFTVSRRNGNWDSGWMYRNKYDWVDEITEELQRKIVETINQIKLP